MARVTAHLSVSELEREYRVAKEATAARHYQAIWLLAKGHTVPAVAEMTSFGTRWLEQLLSRYNARGATALGDQRRHTGRAPRGAQQRRLSGFRPSRCSSLAKTSTSFLGWRAASAATTAASFF